jgi:hypothetical protein
MTEAEQYNLLWLVNAMTLPISHIKEQYYYDGLRKDLFYTITTQNLSYPVILNRSDLRYSEEIESDLQVRLLLIEDEGSELVEIPRINVAEKIAIQLQFLARMPDTYWHNELIKAVEQQKDDFKFVLDTLLIENDNSAPMAKYWDDYKIEIMFNYLYSFLQLNNGLNSIE